MKKDCYVLKKSIHNYCNGLATFTPFGGLKSKTESEIEALNFIFLNSIIVMSLFLSKSSVL